MGGRRLNGANGGEGGSGFSKEELLARLHPVSREEEPEKGLLLPWFGAYISNIVFMGMGEPMENYDAVTKSLKGMTSQRRFGLAQRNCTISTVGIVPMMKRLFSEMPAVKMALSLHAPNQKLREKIVPVSRKYHLDTLMETLDIYAEMHATDGKRKGLIMVSYIMIDGVNDKPEHWKELAALMKDRQVVVNLIPFNSFDPYANQPGGVKPSKGREH